MDDTDLEPVAFTGPDAPSEPDTFADQARRRADTEREVVEWAVAELESLIDAREVDLEPLLEYARRSRESMPDRHVRSYEAMAEMLDVDPDSYEVYAFAYSDLCDELAAEPAADPSRGCTNALVSPSRTGRDGSLVLKNRDIAGRGARPKSVVEQPAIDGYHGFLTVDACGTVMLYKGVNDRGWSPRTPTSTRTGTISSPRRSSATAPLSGACSRSVPPSGRLGNSSSRSRRGS